jgi:hypothetical protein
MVTNAFSSYVGFFLPLSRPQSQKDIRQQSSELTALEVMLLLLICKCWYILPIYVILNPLIRE